MTNLLSDTPDGSFDIGHGPMQPDPAILRHGRVAADSVWSDAQHQGERDAIFRRCWLYMVRAEDLPEPGDFVVRDVEICGVFHPDRAGPGCCVARLPQCLPPSRNAGGRRSLRQGGRLSLPLS